ncbi:MAG: hypothetical protein ACLUIX_03040 [Oscillospiraceae bacterium]
MAHIVYMPPRKFQEEQGQNYVTTLNNEIEMLATMSPAWNWPTASWY